MKKHSHQKKSQLLQPLQGAAVVITRPVGLNRAWAIKVHKLGGQAIQLPGMTLRPNVTTKFQFDRLCSSDIVLFTSPAAVRYAWRAWPQLNFSKTIKIYAVGMTTAAALKYRDIKNAQIPNEQQNSDGLLALKDLRSIRGKKIAIASGEGGREQLQNELCRRGAKVEKIAVYRRSPARLGKPHYGLLTSLTKSDYIFFSSTEAISNLHNNLAKEAWQRLRQMKAIVSSARLAAILKKCGFVRIAIAPSANSHDMLKKLIELHSRQTT